MAVFGNGVGTGELGGGTGTIQTSGAAKQLPPPVVDPGKIAGIYISFIYNSLFYPR